MARFISNVKKRLSNATASPLRRAMILSYYRHLSNFFKYLKDEESLLADMPVPALSGIASGGRQL